MSKQPITSAPQLGLDLASQAMMQHAMSNANSQYASANPGALTQPGPMQTTPLLPDFNANRLDTTLPQTMGQQGGGFDLSKLLQGMKFFGGGG